MPGGVGGAASRDAPLSRLIEMYPGTPGRGHRGSLVGHAGVTVDGVGPVSLRSRTPRIYRSRRASSSAMVSALIMPRVGDHAHARDVEAPEQPVDHRNEGADVGGVARPDFNRDRRRRSIKDHLPQVRAMVLAVAAGPPSSAGVSKDSRHRPWPRAARPKQRRRATPDGLPVKGGAMVASFHACW